MLSFNIMKNKTLTSLFILLFFAIISFAAPRPLIEDVNFEGKIQWWVWREETKIERHEMSSYFKAIIPAHYLIILEDV